MDKKQNVPTVKPSLQDRFHFRDIGWVNGLPSFNHLFHISRIEDYLPKMSFPLPAHRKIVYDIIVLTQGSSVRSKGLNQYSFKKNEIFFLPPYQITSHESVSKGIKGFFIHFSEDLFKERAKDIKMFSFLGFLTNPIVRIPKDELDSVFHLLNQMIKVYESDRPEIDLLISYLEVFLREVNRFNISLEPELEKAKKSVQLTERYKNLLTQEILEVQTVKEYAAMLFVTPNHLNRCVKETMNCTSQDLLNKMLVLEAKSMLKYSGLSIAQISERLCSKSPSNFTRFFKQQTGLTPREYIKNN